MLSTHVDPTKLNTGISLQKDTPVIEDEDSDYPKDAEQMVDYLQASHEEYVSEIGGLFKKITTAVCDEVSKLRLEVSRLNELWSKLNKNNSQCEVHINNLCIQELHLQSGSLTDLVRQVGNIGQSVADSIVPGLQNLTNPQQIAELVKKAQKQNPEPAEERINTETREKAKNG